MGKRKCAYFYLVPLPSTQLLNDAMLKQFLTTLQRSSSSEWRKVLYTYSVTSYSCSSRDDCVKISRLLYRDVAIGIFNVLTTSFYGMNQRIRRYKQKKKLISKISVDSNFTFLSYAWLCVFHCSNRLLCWIKSHVRDFFLWKLLSFHTENL